MKIERRHIAHEFRVSQDAQPVISGYAAVFDTPSNDMGWIEELDPHCFDAVLATKPDVRGLYNHCPDHVLGRTASGTMTLTIDARGLAYTITPPDTTLAKDLMVLMRRGDVNQSSFGFVCQRDQWTDNPDGTITRRILEIGELLDCSIVTYPAYDQATAGVRSLPESMPVEMRSRFESRRKTHTKSVDGENLTDDCFVIVGDPQKTDTWALPWKFSAEEKTKSHLRDALARFGQLQGYSEEQLRVAWTKLVKLCKEHSIAVADTKMPAMRSMTSVDLDVCECGCPQCRFGAHGICSADPQCDFAERSMRMKMRLRLLQLS